ncbi:Blue-light photoreceptor PHR2 [Galdieria sulphuraria]|uniref:Photolyase/blue-light receptor n=1 Tax=Galdieria sulphuraria TaxID=130081 RepID=M2Y274_GALSU|nr:photolyase/blue-light receptor [Galdieria sulphuraria]EME29909.1 photolyase/blue-light receptor [Galdieria sulphuraria]GJD11955.1 Blue-light photoreceptor PHR2 [Galdieria sulphuraria]|eukprot:XP_005706429.1 photolyase/blue-light receptor [Galdieria sulphuraria]
MKTTKEGSPVAILSFVSHIGFSVCKISLSCKHSVTLLPCTKNGQRLTLGGRRSKAKGYERIVATGTDALSFASPEQTKQPKNHKSDNQRHLKTAPLFSPLGENFGESAGQAYKGSKIIVWFRNDLRLHDNPALFRAAEEGSLILPVYCFDPRQFGKTSFGFEKTGRYRAQFLIDSVEDLRKSFRAKGSDLIVRLGRPEEVLPELCRQTGCKRVFCHREVTYEDLIVEEDVGDALESIGVEMTLLWSNTLYQAEDLPFQVENMPDIYTKFRESVETGGKIREPLELSEAFPPRPRCEPGEIPTLTELGLDASPERIPGESNPRSIHGFRGGESESLKRMEDYLSEMRSTEISSTTAGAYLGADFSCKISPWLALGCISPRKIYHEVNGSSVPEDVRKTTYFELVWRDFFRFITQKYGNIRLEKSRHSSSSKRKVPSGNQFVATCG